MKSHRQRVIAIERMAKMLYKYQMKAMHISAINDSISISIMLHVTKISTNISESQVMLQCRLSSKKMHDDGYEPIEENVFSFDTIERIQEAHKNASYYLTKAFSLYEN